MTGIPLHPLRIAALDRHPYSPELWTWGYPMEVRLKLNEKEEMP